MSSHSVGKSHPGRKTGCFFRVLLVLIGLGVVGGLCYALVPAVRVGVINVLGWIGGPALPLVIAAHQDESMDVQVASFKVLIKAGKTAVPPLTKELTHPDANRRAFAALVLERIGPDAAEALPALVEVGSKDNDPEARQQAIKAMGQVGANDEKLVLSPLIAFLDDGDADIRHSAVVALGFLGPRAKAAVKGLSKRLKDSSIKVRLEVTEVLEKLGRDAEESIPALEEAVKTDPDASVRREAKETLDIIKRAVSQGQ
jgi:HEAT repeat protein